MSGEFGHHRGGGYFHEQVANAADDCSDLGNLQVTKNVGKILDSLVPIAEAVSWAEASDTIEADAILSVIKNISTLEKSVENLKQYIKPFEDVMKRAIK